MEKQGCDWLLTCRTTTGINKSSTVANGHNKSPTRMRSSFFAFLFFPSLRYGTFNTNWLPSYWLCLWLRVVTYKLHVNVALTHPWILREYIITPWKTRVLLIIVTIAIPQRFKWARKAELRQYERQVDFTFARFLTSTNTNLGLEFRPLSIKWNSVWTFS